MKIESNKIDEVRAVITMQIEKEDYAQDLEKTLKSYRQKASIPGFRVGKVPMSVIHKMYGKSALLDQVNKVLSEKLFEYIREQDLDILGEPIPTENFPSIDIDTQETFDFSFDVALVPDLTELFTLSKKDKVEYYKIPATEEDVKTRLDHYKAQFGAQIHVDAATEEKDLIKVDIKELDGKTIKEGGIHVEEVFISINKIEDKTILKKIQNIEKGAVTHFKPYKAYKNEAEVAGMLKITPEEVEQYKDTDFEFTVIEILRFQEAELNTELFDKVYNNAQVATEEEFRAKIKAEIEGVNHLESEFKFAQSAKDQMIAKLEGMKVSDDVLKRWLLASNDDLSMEEVEESYDSMIRDLKWQLIKSKVVKDYELKMEPADELNYAKKVAKVQFLQYGMMGMPQEMMDNYAERMLQSEEEYPQIKRGAFEEKVIETIKEHVTLDEKEITHEEFNKLLEAEK